MTATENWKGRQKKTFLGFLPNPLAKGRSKKSGVAGGTHLWSQLLEKLRQSLEPREQAPTWTTKPHPEKRKRKERERRKRKRRRRRTKRRRGGRERKIGFLGPSTPSPTMNIRLTAGYSVSPHERQNNRLLPRLLSVFLSHFQECTPRSDQE